MAPGWVMAILFTSSYSNVCPSTPLENAAVNMDVFSGRPKALHWGFPPLSRAISRTARELFLSSAPVTQPSQSRVLYRISSSRS